MDDKQQGGVEQAMQRRREREAEVARTVATLRVLQAEMREALDACDRVAEASLPKDPVAAARVWSPLWLAMGQLYGRAIERCGTPAGEAPRRDDDIAAALWRSVLAGVGTEELKRDLAGVLRDLGVDARLIVSGHFEELRGRIEAMYRPVLAAAIAEETRARGWTVPANTTGSREVPDGSPNVRPARRDRSADRRQIESSATGDQSIESPLHNADHDHVRRRITDGVLATRVIIAIEELRSMESARVSAGQLKSFGIPRATIHHAAQSWSDCIIEGRGTRELVYPKKRVIQWVVEQWVPRAARTVGRSTE